MKNAPILALTLALMTTAPLAVAQVATVAEILQAKAAYTVETMKSDALCGEASVVWQGNSAAVERGFISNVRKIVDAPPQGQSHLGSYATKTDIQVNGMRVVGLESGTQYSSIKLNFDLPSKEVFANLPGQPVMQMTQDIPGSGVQIWTEKKPKPADGSNQRRLGAFSYQNHTQVFCERSHDFNLRKR